MAFIGQKGFPAHWGGIEAHVDTLARLLAARGHEVVVFVRPWYSPATDPVVDGVRAIRRPTLHTKHLDAAVHSLLCALDTMVRPLDVVHFHGVGPALFAGLPRMAGRRVVVTIHGRDYENPKWGSLARSALRLGERLSYRHAQRTIVVSPTLGDGVPDARPAVWVPNGVGPADPAAPSEILSRQGLGTGTYLLSLCRWAPEKRVAELVEAFIALAPAGLRLVVAGDDEQRGGYARRVREAARGSPSVVLPGWVEGRVKRELLSNARGFVTFSAREGMPIALLEAMAYGLPCLASDIAAHRAVLGSAHGVLCPADTSEQRRLALSHLLALPDAARRLLGDSARTHVLAHYSWDSMAAAVEAIYEEVVAEPPRA